ncbi:family 43 glycosylhydrolase [Herbidospora sp. NEAU-GS84]|uniref:Family 43 glycosylhydrolase n=1 Tax=Herbidospora solisilvae TaxID=2696284 RepID=A0A7C9J422_9ACTN|nr:AbfB domain-containing protein [Herbidospora solisilvae]NAS23240.1 family 43 glycosylhydrolase [Herbidospora solisilvae]
MLRRSLLPLVVLIAALLHPTPANAAGPAPHYLMTAFTNASESNMYVYDSSNATNYNLIRSNAYTPPSGLIRDPSVIKHTDGYYHLVYTTGWTGNTIGFARSADAVTWTFQRNVTVGLNGSTGSTWAPEWFRDSDGSVHVVFSASTTGTAGQFRPYRITASNSALSAWSAPTALGIPANYIDSFLVKVDGTYHNFLKNETTKYIEHATATSLNGPWTFVGTGNWAGWGSGLEGPALVRLPDNRWRIYFDNYSGGRYYYADSSNLSSFSGRTELSGLSGTARHFTVIREDSGDTTALPTGNRSLRAGSLYVRHRDYQAYLENVSSTSPLLQRQDSTFTIGAGLAHSGCYSFQAINFPGYYLRHYNMQLVLQRNDGSAIFRGDATFCARGALLESYNLPGKFLNGSLRLDPTGTAFTVTAPLA